MIDTLIQRINELETQLAHQERMTEDLSIVITKQGTDVDKLNQKVNHLIDQFKAFENTNFSPPVEDQVPPHY
jgi:SlyX protein